MQQWRIEGGCEGGYEGGCEVADRLWSAACVSISSARATSRAGFGRGDVIARTSQLRRWRLCQARPALVTLQVRTSHYLSNFPAFPPSSP